jgi:lipid II:glycine glycyltransferase (peptidoglycan interpeptide bridge formation enzyme)
MEIQPSPLYQKYLRKIGWKVTEIDNTVIYSKNIPLAGTIAKIQRPHKLPEIKKFINQIKSLRAKNIAFEPDLNISQTDLDKFISECRKNGLSINHSPFLPTKTIRINLKPNEEDIFNSFSEAKRRAVRKAQKNRIIVTETQDIKELLRIKNKSAGFLGFITTFGIDKLWPILAPDHACTVLAYHKEVNPKNLVGGILLLFFDKICYYWIAGAVKTGKKLFAPTLLVWEAVKIGKAHGCSEFDFVGVWDERFPNDNKSWLGFTKFKEGFGGKEIYYPVAK